MARSFYAVILDDGQKKICRTNAEFQQLLKWQRHSQHKGFDSYMDACVWLDSPADFPREKLYYAVRKGHKPGIYRDTNEFLAQLRGYAGCEGKGFYTLAGARHWLNEGRGEACCLEAAEVRYRLTERFQDAKSLAGNILHWLWVMLSTSLYKRRQLRQRLLDLSERQKPWLYCRIKTDNPLVIYTDASYRKRKGTGYAAVIIDTVTNAEFYVGGQDKEIRSSCRAELCAIIRALQMIDSKCAAPVEIRTDALSLVMMASPKKLKHLHDLHWKKKSVANIDLWQQFYEFTQQRTIMVNWVRGHNGNRYNGSCDRIAGQCAEH